MAIMSFPYSYSILGLVPGLIITVVVAMSVLYTSLIVWYITSLPDFPSETALILIREFCLRHPELRDICDVGQMLYFGWTWAWYLTAAMFLLNNTFIQVRVGSSVIIRSSLMESGSPRIDWRQIPEYHEQWRRMHRWLFRHLGSPFLCLLSSKDIRHSFEARHALCYFHVHFRPFGSHLRRDRSSPLRLQHGWQNGLTGWGSSSLGRSSCRDDFCQWNECLSEHQLHLHRSNHHT